MYGILKQLVGAGKLQTLTQIHDHDVVGDVLDDAEVVGNEHIGQAHFVLQVHQQVQDLSLNGHVQRGHRLITDDELGIHGQGAGDADTLAAAAVQLVGIRRGIAAGQAHHVHQVRCVVEDLLLCGQRLVDEHVLGDDLDDGLTGVQAGVGVLEDDLELLTHLLHLAGVVLGDVLPVVEDLAGGRLDKPQNGAAQGAFSAAGLAHHADGLTGIDLHVDTVHRVEVGLVAHLEVLFQVYRFQQRGSFFSHGSVLLFLA